MALIDPLTPSDPLRGRPPGRIRYQGDRQGLNPLAYTTNPYGLSVFGAMVL